MNDDDLSELILRASAYLDGDLDAGAAALAEADAAVMAEVEALRALQAELADVDPAPSATRESAIAAALAEFDQRRIAPVPTVSPARVVPFRPRPAYARWLTAAAAVVAVGVLGAVVLNGGGGDDDEAGNAALDASPATLMASDSGRTAQADGAFESATAEAADSAAEFAESAESAPAGGGDLQASATTAATAATEMITAAGPPDDTESTQAPVSYLPFDPERAITSTGELAAVGAELQAQVDAGTIGVTVETSCDPFPFVPLKAGRYDDGTGPRDVVIAVDAAIRQVQAIDAVSCAVLAETPLP